MNDPSDEAEIVDSRLAPRITRRCETERFARKARKAE